MAKHKNQRENVFFNKNVFDMSQKLSASFSGVLFVENHEGNKWRYTKNQITYFKFLFCCFRFDRALER